MSLFYVAALVAGILLLIVLNRSLVYIPNNRVGVVEKLVSGKGSVRSGLIALDGEAGFQPDVLRGGWHFLMPFQYRVHKMPLVTIPQGEIGYVFARDGHPLPPTQTLASQPARQRLPGRRAVPARRRPEGPAAHDPARRHLRHQPRAVRRRHRTDLYYLPLDRSEEAVFAKMAQLIGERDGFQPVVIRGADDRIGVVTVHDGPAVPSGEIIAPLVGDDPAQAADLPQQLPGPREVPARRRPARPPAPGARRGHLLHQPPVRDRGADPQDRRRGRHGRRRRLLHRRQRPRPLGQGLQARRAGDGGASAACGASRCCPASTRSTPTPAR